MLRIYFPQQCPDLPNPVDEESLYDIESMRPAEPRLGKDVIPDETSLLNFRHLLEKHKLTIKIFEGVKAYLEEQGVLLAEDIQAFVKYLGGQMKVKRIALLEEQVVEFGL